MKVVDFIETLRAGNVLKILNTCMYFLFNYFTKYLRI